MPDNRLYIFDTTLRDGEQSPGASMTVEEKLSIAKMLEDMSVDVMEMGFPSASKGDFEVATRLADIVKETTVCALARCHERDISIAHDALLNVKKKRLHIFISTSALHMKYKLGMTPDAVLESISYHVAFAKNLFEEVEFSAEDATRTDKDFLACCINAAIDAGAGVINIPDTVGYSTPNDMFTLISDIKKLPKIEQCILSVHCHNDLGLAVANSLSAALAGARQIECTINGLGERAGNASLEEIVMACKVRNDHFPFETNVQTKLFLKASSLVSHITHFPVQYNKAIVGRNAFSHESGIHQDGMLKHQDTYEIMRPESVGFESSSLVLGKLSGRHAFSRKLESLGYKIDDANKLSQLFKAFKNLTTKKRRVYEDDLREIIEEKHYVRPIITLISLKVVAGSASQSASIVLNINGEEKKEEAHGEGPVDAIFQVIKKIIPHKATLLLYDVASVTGGSTSEADVRVRLEERSITFYGRGLHVDTLVASALAYIEALNKIQQKKNITSSLSLHSSDD